MLLPPAPPIYLSFPRLVMTQPETDPQSAIRSGLQRSTPRCTREKSIVIDRREPRCAHNSVSITPESVRIMMLQIKATVRPGLHS